MFPSEMVILMAIAVNKDAGNKLLTRPMDVTSEYVGYLYQSLVRRGYIKGGGLRGYQLTPMGRQVILEFLYKNGNRANDVIKRLQRLGIECSDGVDKLGKEGIKVKQKNKTISFK